MPYLHRFDILQRNGKNFFIGCTLSSAKNAKDDWSNPGSVYVGELPEDENGELVLTELRNDFFKNQGYERVTWNGLQCGMVSCKSGIYIFTPPSSADDAWSIEQIMSQPTSDIACIDIDGDGQPEIATIEEFHGSYFRVYKMIDGEYRQIFEHPEVSEFYHVAASGKINGNPVFMGGCRRGKQQLFILSYNQETAKIEIHTVDENVGPSNAMNVNLGDRDIIISANREIGQAAIYDIEP